MSPVSLISLSQAKHDSEGASCISDRTNSLQQYRQRVPKRQHHTKQHHLILLRPTNDVEHHIPLHLIHHDPIIIKYDIPIRLVRLLRQALFEGLLVLDGGVRAGARVGGARGRVDGRVGSGVVFCQEAVSVVGGEDKDGVDGEEGHVCGHGGRW